MSYHRTHATTSRIELARWDWNKMVAIFQTMFQMHYFPERKCMNFESNFTEVWSVSKKTIDNIPAIIQIVDWRRAGDKPLSEPRMFSLLKGIYASLGLNELKGPSVYDVCCWFPCTWKRNYASYAYSSNNFTGEWWFPRSVKRMYAKSRGFMFLICAAS